MLLQCDLILTDDICNDSFQIRSHSEVQGIRTSPYAFAQNAVHSIADTQQRGSTYVLIGGVN